MLYGFSMIRKLLFTWLLSSFEQRFQISEKFCDAAQLPVDLDVLNPRRTVAHHTAISCSVASTGPNQHIHIYISLQDGKLKMDTQVNHAYIIYVLLYVTCTAYARTFLDTQVPSLILS